MAIFALVIGFIGLLFVLGGSALYKVFGLVVAGYIAFDWYKTRLVKTTYHTVTLKVYFSEEEKQVIKDAKLDGVLVMERDLDRYQQHLEAADKRYLNPHLTIGGVMDAKPDVRRFLKPINARNYQLALETYRH